MRAGLAVLPIGLALAACPVVAPIAGQRCTGDLDCRDPAGAVFHCELAADPHVCLPGADTVAGRPNRPPVGTATLIVGVAGSTFHGTLGFVDPDGDDVTITTTAVFFGGGNDVASLSIDDPATGAYTLSAQGGAIDETQSLTVDDGHSPVDIGVHLALVAADASLLTWTGSSSGDFADGTNWDPPVAPDANHRVLVATDDRRATISAAANVSDAFLAGASLAIDDTLTVAHHAYLAGAVAGDGVVVVDEGGAVGGNFPDLALNGAVQATSAIAARSVDGAALAVPDHGAVVVDAALQLGVLALDAGAVADAGALALGSLQLTGAAANVDFRTVVSHGDVAIGAVAGTPGARWRLFVDGQGVVAVSAPAYGDVVIGEGARARFDGGSIDDVVLEGGIGTDPDRPLLIGTLHLARAPQSLDGSGEVFAAHCDTPTDVVLALPPYLHCDDAGPVEGEGEGGEGEGGEGEGGEGEGEGEGPGEGEGEGEGPGEGEGEGAGGPDPAAPSYGEPSCSGADDAVLSSSTIVLRTDTQVTDTLPPADPTQQLATGNFSALPGSPTLLVSSGNLVTVAATGVPAGVYGLTAQIAPAGVPACLHVHVVDPAAVTSAVASGPWSAAATWQGGAPPLNAAYIPGGLDVTVDDDEVVGDLFVENDAIVGITDAGSLRVKRALVAGGGLAAQSNAAPPAVHDAVELASGAVVTGRAGHVIVLHGSTTQIGSVAAEEVLVAIADTAPSLWHVGPHRLEARTLSFSAPTSDNPAAGLQMDADATFVHAAASFRHTMPVTVPSGVQWSTGTLVVENTPVIAPWPSSSQQHNTLWLAAVGGLSQVLYSGILHIPPQQNPTAALDLQGVFEGTLDLGTTATTTTTVTVGTLHLDAPGLVSNTGAWTVGSCASSPIVEPPCP